MGSNGENTGGGVDAVDVAWSQFRVRLADRLAAFEDDDVLVVEVQVGLDHDELIGAAPYLQFCGWGGDLVRAEVAGNRHLDERFGLDSDEEERLRQTWHGPEDDEPNFHLDVERREADRLAVLAVAALREVYGVLHPSFLRADGLEPAEPAVQADPEAPRFDPDATTLPHSHEELQALVDEALAQVLDTVEHDEDGDVPIRTGLSTVYVRVHPDRPAVEVFAELVSDPTQPARMPVELDILNRSHAFARFALHGTAVRMSHVVPAWPFVPRLLNLVVAQFLEDADAVARDLAARIGGRRFLEEPEPEEHPERTTEPKPHPGLVGLVELLEIGPVASPVVGHLFDHDRSALIAHLVGIRTGRVDLAALGEDVDVDQVLTCLRRGLRHVVDGELPERRPRRLPPRPRTEQPSLLSDDDAGEDTLDLGHSA